MLNPQPKVEPGDGILWQARANYVEGPSMRRAPAGRGADVRIGSA
jgi:hypothetical protein